MNIYVANLSFNTKSEDLRSFFSPYGELKSVNVIVDKVTNRSRGFGFVEMDDEVAAKKAISELDGMTIDNRVIKVNEARPKEERAPRTQGRYDNRPSDGFNNSKSYNENRY